ncbi:MAG: hypothetical protein AUF67_04575 [Acidobacteria bacterium 13_1_20CM_58_21]|nr:MAG: hypothetical protein AUF67_04575 [Acidobacteria bacterium 13_1_20CM_58_21]
MTKEENSPSCLPQRFLRRGGSFTWTQTNRTWRRVFVDRAVKDAAFIMERIDARWPLIINSFSAQDL